MIEIEMTMKPDLTGNALHKVVSFFSSKETLSEQRFRQLLEPVKEHLYNFIFKGLNFSQDADDVFQETVLRAFKYRKGFDARKTGSFKTWLFTIANNQIKAFYNQQVKTNYTGSAVLDSQLTDNSSDLNKKQMVRDIYEIAMLLNPKQRKVFFLFYDHHFSIKEIQQITGLKEGNIKFILNRSRRQIKEKLAVGDKKIDIKSKGSHHE